MCLELSLLLEFLVVIVLLLFLLLCDIGFLVIIELLLIERL